MSHRKKLGVCGGVWGGGVEYVRGSRGVVIGNTERSWVCVGGGEGGQYVRGSGGVVLCHTERSCVCGGGGGVCKGK